MGSIVISTWSVGSTLWLHSLSVGRNWSPIVLKTWTFSPGMSVWLLNFLPCLFSPHPSHPHSTLCLYCLSFQIIFHSLLNLIYCSFHKTSLVPQTLTPTCIPPTLLPFCCEGVDSAPRSSILIITINHHLPHPGNTLRGKRRGRERNGERRRGRDVGEEERPKERKETTRTNNSMFCLGMKGWKDCNTYCIYDDG